MTRLIFNKGILNVIISEEEQLNIDNAKELVRKTRRMIIQNKASCLVIEIDTISKVNENALDLVNRVLCHSSNFPVVMIGA